MRSRRSCLSVPGSNPKMMAKGAGLAADEVFLDLEDSVAPAAKEEARHQVVHALESNDWGDKTVAVRINAVDTQWAADDVRTVIEGAGERIHCVMIPKVQHAHEVMLVDHLLRMLEVNNGLERRIGIEAQIETALGLEHVFDIAHSSSRLETLIFGPADMSASLGLPVLTAGLPAPDYPGDHWHWVLERILVAARAAGLQAIDGPYLRIKDLDGFRVVAVQARSLGYDGKWAVHPGQIDVLNEVFTPTQEDFDRAEALLAAYREAVEVQEQGAVMFGTEMIDEASRKMAERFAERGRAAGMKPVKTLDDWQRDWAE
ncbi:aldolase/citrate lyase family protein [soil metagenome]